MKSGASDPFKDDSTDEQTDQPEEDNPDSMTDSTADSVTLGSNTEQLSREDLPFKLRRDSVKDERENVHQLFVQSSTDGRAKDKERELEELIGEDIYRLDAREAIYLAGMKNLDDAADILREWGYDF